MSLSYAEFVASKRKRHGEFGIDAQDIHPSLFDFQSAIVRWALKKGRACVFAGTGLGKTRMQCEIMRHVPGKRLLVAPLAVAEQTITEARDLSGMRIQRVHHGDDVRADGVYIVNYDRLHHVEGIPFDAVGLDESSIIKSHDGAYRQYIQERFSKTPYRFAFTATPSPNDYMELATHAEFMGAMTRNEMLATYFMHDGGDTSQWRLKRHARADFWEWVSSWAVVLNHPSDLGYHQDGYNLPELRIHDHIVEVESTIGGGLFGDASVSATKLHKVLKDSAEDRVDVVRQLVEADPRDWLIWVNTDHEQNLIEKAIPGIASVRGSDSEKDKTDRLLGFATGVHHSLVTKPKIAGFGMNWQRCHKMAFCGVTYSFEQMYQAIRRCWRFGQTSPVDVHVVTCNAQETVKAALESKRQAFMTMAQEMGRYCIQEVSK